MDRQAVQSSEIAIVGYDEKQLILELTFRRGGVYHYFKVPSDLYRALIEAPSLGAFFSERIKDQFTYQKIS